jgi:hypothetical protein
VSQLGLPQYIGLHLQSLNSSTTIITFHNKHAVADVSLIELLLTLQLYSLSVRVDENMRKHVLFVLMLVKLTNTPPTVTERCTVMSTTHATFNTTVQET